MTFSQFFSKKVLSCLAIFAGLTPSIGLGADDALYEKAIDPNAAFVRVVSAQTLSPRIGGKQLPAIEQAVSAYQVVEPSIVKVSHGGTAAELQAEPGKFYSVISQGPTAIVVEDKAKPNPAKAVLSFYNLTDATGLDLFVPKAKANAFSGLNKGQGKSVQIKAPLTLDFVARQDGSDLAMINGVKLVRGGGTTIVAFEKDGQIALAASSNSINR